jgi:hypothetical protein
VAHLERAHEHVDPGSVTGVQEQQPGAAVQGIELPIGLIAEAGQQIADGPPRPAAVTRSMSW